VVRLVLLVPSACPVLLVRRAHEVKRVTLVLRAAWALWDRKVRSVRLVSPANPARQVRWATPVTPVRKAIVEPRVRPAIQAVTANPAPQVFPVSKAKTARWADKDPLVPPDPAARKAPKAASVSSDLRDLSAVPVLLGQREIAVHLALTDLLVPPAKLVRPVLKASRVPPALSAYPAKRGQLVALGRTGHQDRKASAAAAVSQVLAAPLEKRAKADLWVLPANKENLALLDPWALLGRSARSARQVRKAPRARRVRKARPASKVSLVTWVQSVLAALRVTAVLKASLAKKVFPDHREKRAKSDGTDPAAPTVM